MNAINVSMEKNGMKRMINVSKETREKLVKLFDTTPVSVWRALSFKDDSATSRRIRRAAELNGGVFLLLSPAMETLHDAAGVMRQDFPGDVLIEVDKLSGRCDLLKQGVVVESWDGLSVTALMEVQERAAQLSGLGLEKGGEA